MPNIKTKNISTMINTTIKNKIYTIRGMQVMLDRDLAELYEVEPRRLREQVNRNIKRFPEDFMFRLTDTEVDFMVSQIATPSRKYFGGSLPLVFTEQGVSMLSSILNSQRAIEVSIQIMRAFVEIRRFLITNAEIFKRLDGLENKQIEFKCETDKKFEKIFEAMDEKNKLEKKQGIFFDGQIFDAYKFVADLIRKATKSIVIIDNFVDDRTFLLLTKRQKGVKATIWTKNITRELLLDLRKHNAQYPAIELKEFKKAHDRFLILDDTEVYLFGTSLKDLGTKWFGFSRMEMESLKIIEKIKELEDKNFSKEKIIG